MRILIADDEPLLQLLLRAQFELRGAQIVAEVETAAAVADALAETHPDVAILDYNLADGPITTALPRARVVSPATFLVVLSADAADQRGAEVVAAGAHTYYEKTPDLVRAFPEWLENAHAEHRRDTP